MTRKPVYWPRGATKPPREGGRKARPPIVPQAPFCGPPRVFVVEGIPRSGKNSTRRAVNKATGKGFQMKSKAAAKWLDAAVLQLAAQRGGLSAIAGACLIDLTIFHALPLSTWDKDNVVNLVYDALKHAHILVDDKAAVARQGAQMTYVDKARPRVEVRIGACTKPLTWGAA